MTTTTTTLHQTHDLDTETDAYTYHFPLTPIPSVRAYIHPAFRTEAEYIHYFDDDEHHPSQQTDRSDGDDGEDDGFPVPPPRNPLRLSVKPLFAARVQAKEVDDSFSIAETLSGSPRASASVRYSKVSQEEERDGAWREHVDGSEHWHDYTPRSSTSTAAEIEDNRRSHFTELLTPPASDMDEGDDSAQSPLPSQTLRRARPLQISKPTVRSRPMSVNSASSIAELPCPLAVNDGEWRLFLFNLQAAMETLTASHTAEARRMKKCPHRGLAAGKRIGGRFGDRLLHRERDDVHDETEAQVVDEVVANWNQRWEDQGVRVSLVMTHSEDIGAEKKQSKRRLLRKDNVVKGG